MLKSLVINYLGRIESVKGERENGHLSKIALLVSETLITHEQIILKANGSKNAR